ncbi:MAG TPA: hypothetical protein VH092_00910, partial [Urbifossiella sp.]|nr:hypothetical protein [Urbifossiella sp.]
MRHRGVTLGLVAVVALAGVGLAVWAAWPAPARAPDWADDYAARPDHAGSPGDYDLTPKLPAEIAPGTVVGTTPPAGWSHLVIKSLPRVREDQRAGLLKLTVEKAGWMFTAFLADVGRDPDGSFALKKIGLGLGAKGKRGDTIATADSAERVGIEVGVLRVERIILDKG